MNNTDRELLELAAKAMGFQYKDGMLCSSHCVEDYDWSPLEDSAQALWMAADLQINISWGYHVGGKSNIVCGAMRHQYFKGREWEIVTAKPGEEGAAMRRAIVQAAARYGRTLA